jgi:hypothetical protein
MATVTVQIWHDLNDGKILAVGRLPQGAKHGVILIAGQRQGVVETQIEEDAIRGLHESHRVDIHNKSLIKVRPEEE